MAAELILDAKTKYIKINLYFIRDKDMSNQLEVGHVSDLAKQVADIFTKANLSYRFSEFRFKL